MNVRQELNFKGPVVESSYCRMQCRLYATHTWLRPRDETGMRQLLNVDKIGCREIIGFEAAYL